MSITEKNNFNLEDNFNDENLNKLFKNLDEETKKKILKYPKKDIQIEILRNLSNTELTKLWDSLNEKEKKHIDSFGIRDRFIFLKDKLKKKNFKKTNIIPIPTKILEEGEIEEDTDFENNILKEAPPEIFEEEEEEKVEIEKKNLNSKEKNTSQQRLDNLIKIYYMANSTNTNIYLHNELEVRFGTKGVKYLTRNDYDNVIKKLKSSGFKIVGDSSGQYYLRINCEFLDSTTGKVKLSDVRTEIKGIQNIHEYCKSNDLKQIFMSNSSSVDFIHKKPAFINSQRIYPIDFDDFNFRVSYQTEEKIKKGVQNFVIDNWKKSKKEFRFINRVSFEHPDHPFIIDISITKSGNKSPDRFGRENRGQTIRVYSIEESNIFNNQEVYEIEIEINNKNIGPSTKFNNYELIASSLRKVIKYILSGLQGTNYPISYPEQKQVIYSYMKLLGLENIEPKFISSKNFIGPNSVTLQLKNITPIDENSNEPNIRKNFVVTEKADGMRNLMFITENGKIYLINSSMDIIFTGAKTLNPECFNTIIDGELITHDKNGKFINLYAAFDIYFVKKEDVRAYTFMLLNEEKDIYKSRYQLLNYIGYNLKPISITNSSKIPSDAKGIDNLLNSFSIKNNDFISPIKFAVKEFFPSGKKENIFNGCRNILQKIKENRYEYTTDGLIFTHSFYGVGSNEVGKAGPKSKITWENSFKWKPPHFNTIDFLVTTLKGPNGDDVIKSYFEDGINNNESVQYNEYKVIELRCGFKESKDGYINPCQDIIDDKIPEFNSRSDNNNKNENDYIPMRFYPTDPYDINAGICNIMLRADNNGGKKMFSEDNEVFEDNNIVEFRYDLDKKSGWNWIPLRVRYDKTSKLRRGEKEYGNSYKVCNENWKSIHPNGRITEEMLYTGLNIPTLSVSEDIYYNKPSGKFITESMKDFHNLFVKKKLIVGVSKPGDNLIDFACGKAGDLPKWINAKLSFVFGIDISKDNLENRLDGACARYLNFKKTKKYVPNVLFVNGNSAFNIKDGTGLLNEKAKQISLAVFGKGSKDIGKGVAKQYGKGIDGFNISSCQFAIHYFFENPNTLMGFMKNIAECTKQNGYFIGTCYDGNLVFNELKKTKTGQSISIIENEKKIWEITKSYSSDVFQDNSSSIGYKIDVYQESINQTITEYLVNFDYLNRIMSAYGFEIINREEANEMGLPEGSGLFSELFSNMLEEIAKNKFKANDYAKAANMTSPERKISFLNRYFIYKKIRTVNIENIQLELNEYEETENQRNDYQESVNAQKIATSEIQKIKPKIRKLKKKIMLVAATEAIDENNVELKPTVTEKNRNDKLKKSKKLLIIESDEEE